MVQHAPQKREYNTKGRTVAEHVAVLGRTAVTLADPAWPAREAKTHTKGVAMRTLAPVTLANRTAKQLPRQTKWATDHEKHVSHVGKVGHSCANQRVTLRLFERTRHKRYPQSARCAVQQYDSASTLNGVRTNIIRSTRVLTIQSVRLM